MTLNIMKVTVSFCFKTEKFLPLRSYVGPLKGTLKCRGLCDKIFVMRTFEALSLEIDFE